MGILARYPAYGPAYVAHRMRRESKLVLGTVPRSTKHWPFEQEVMQLFEQMSPDFAATKEAHRIARLPENLRKARQQLLARRGRRCNLRPGSEASEK